MQVTIRNGRSAMKINLETIERGLYKVSEPNGPVHYFDRKREAEGMVRQLRKEGQHGLLVKKVA